MDGDPAPGGHPPDPAAPGPGSGREVPPGQSLRQGMPVRHYGPVPRVGDPPNWTMIFGGWTASGEVHRLTMAELGEMKQTRVVADAHCAGGWTAPDNCWEGVAAAELLAAFPPAPGAHRATVYGQYGYSASLAIADLAAPGALLATHLDGEPLAPERGFPVRLVVPHRYTFKGPKWFRGWEFDNAVRRGFWEERGYHLRADPWLEERYSYLETHPRPAPGPGTAGPGAD